MKKNHFEVIIVGGSYAGLSAAMALGRSLRKVLIIDGGKPCNRQTPHSHNFITHDGETPKAIAEKAKQQVLCYETITYRVDFAIEGITTKDGFEIRTQSGEIFTAQKLIFATGIKDIMPSIEGFAESWGISVIHCPYCHGYEVRNEKTGILANGDIAFEMAKLISHWTKELTVFTNGKSSLTREQTEKLAQHNIKIVEKEIKRFDHEGGYIKNVVFKDDSHVPLKAMYARVLFEQHSTIPQQLGCELTEHGYIKTDFLQKTSVPGVYACGDNAQLFRAVSVAVAGGTTAGGALNRELIEEVF